MFGYLNINEKSIEKGQRGLWQAFMCGLCFSTKNIFGNIPRVFITNDINLFNVLFNAVSNVDVMSDKRHCVSHPINKQTVIMPTVITDKLAVSNVLLTYFNVYDDVVDGGSFVKKSALKSFQKYYDKARNLAPDLDTIIGQRYNELRKHEQSNCTSIDVVADSFALLSQDFCTEVLGNDANKYVQTLCYNLGKWVYLIDALDDLNKDVKNNNYNPFVKCYNVTNYVELSKYADEVKFTMYSVLNRIAQSFNDMNLSKYKCVLQNVLLDSIRAQTDKVLNKLTKNN